MSIEAQMAISSPVPGAGPGSAKSDQVCIPNISPQERFKRLIGGIIPLALGLAALITLMATGVSPWWRIALLPLFMGATVGFFQWRDKT